MNRNGVAIPWVVLAVAVLGGCGNNEPGVKAIEVLGPYMSAHVDEGCMMLPKNFGEEANKYSDALMKMPSRYNKDFDSKSKKIKDKFGARLAGPCATIIEGSDKCNLDGASNISGFGQQVIDICKAVK